MNIVIQSRPADRGVVEIGKKREEYLGNDSLYPIVISELSYGSVTHYVESKKYEGTVYEEEIRLCKCISQVKMKVRERTRVQIDMSTNTLNYSRVSGNKEIRISTTNSLDKQTRNNIRTAILAKFNQYPILKKKLLETYPKKIITSLSSRNTCKFSVDVEKYSLEVIVELRESLVNPESKGVRSLRFRNAEIPLVITVVSDISKRVASMENWDSLFPEMVSDAAIIIYSPYQKGRQLFPKEIPDTPYSNHLYDMINTALIILFPKQTSLEGPVRELQRFISWCCITKTLEIVHNRCEKYYDIYKGNQKLLKKIKNIKLVKGERVYRNKMLQK